MTELKFIVRNFFLLLKHFFLVGNDIGPQITISNSIFEMGDILEYTCIENGDDEKNRLATKFDNGTVVPFGKWSSNINKVMMNNNYNGLACQFITQYVQLVTFTVPLKI